VELKELWVCVGVVCAVCCLEGAPPLFILTTALDIWGLDEAEKLAHMSRQKGLGNQYFKMGLFKKACVRYDAALECFTDKMIGALTFFFLHT